MSVAVGELCPDFELKNQFGETVKPQTISGTRRMLYSSSSQGASPGSALRNSVRSGMTSRTSSAMTS